MWVRTKSRGQPSLPEIAGTRAEQTNMRQPRRAGAVTRNRQGRCAAVGGAPHRQQNAELRIEAPVGEDARLTGEAKAAQGSGSAHDSASEATVPQSEPMPRHMRVGSIRTRSP